MSATQGGAHGVHHTLDDDALFDTANALADEERAVLYDKLQQLVLVGQTTLRRLR